MIPITNIIIIHSEAAKHYAIDCLLVSNVATIVFFAQTNGPQTFNRLSATTRRRPQPTTCLIDSTHTRQTVRTYQKKTCYLEKSQLHGMRIRMCNVADDNTKTCVVHPHKDAHPQQLHLRIGNELRMFLFFGFNVSNILIFSKINPNSIPKTLEETFYLETPNCLPFSEQSLMSSIHSRRD